MATQRATYQWGRIAAFLLGIGLLLVALRIGLFGILPDPLAAGLCSIPAAACLYGVTDLSWRSAVLSGLGAGIGIATGTYLSGTVLAMV
ncbi:hypothetical protein [Natronosalvus caseinilyticus]|uniref:hypothetical protein n=1 Tax=Natronosalvus caseinilyticus TaxID=2953747 RepID=UPI0028AF89A2|nr:hypothetical protein [Natronosalvus caseinilyticus]